MVARGKKRIKGGGGDGPQEVKGVRKATEKHRVEATGSNYDAFGWNTTQRP
jgi:hypothetical protein